MSFGEQFEGSWKAKLPFMNLFCENPGKQLSEQMFIVKTRIMINLTFETVIRDARVPDIAIELSNSEYG